MNLSGDFLRALAYELMSHDVRHVDFFRNLFNDSRNLLVARTAEHRRYGASGDPGNLMKLMCIAARALRKLLCGNNFTLS